MELAKLAIEFLKVQGSYWGTGASFLFHQGHATIHYPSGLQFRAVIGNSPRLGVYVYHHGVKSFLSLVLDMGKGPKMAVVHIKVCICRELYSLLDPSAPLVKRSIKLIN